MALAAGKPEEFSALFSLAEEILRTAALYAPKNASLFAMAASFTARADAIYMTQLQYLERMGVDSLKPQKVKGRRLSAG